MTEVSARKINNIHKGVPPHDTNYLFCFPLASYMERLDEDILAGLDSWAVMELVGHGYRELEDWGKSIFGRTDEKGQVIRHHMEKW
jgi:hypothetical protein